MIVGHLADRSQKLHTNVGCEQILGHFIRPRLGFNAPLTKLSNRFGSSKVSTFKLFLKEIIGDVSTIFP